MAKVISLNVSDASNWYNSVKCRSPKTFNTNEFYAKLRKLNKNTYEGKQQRVTNLPEVYSKRITGINSNSSAKALKEVKPNKRHSLHELFSIKKHLYMY